MTYDPVGWGLPYNYLLSSDDLAETLAELSLHTSLLLLNRHQTLSSNVFRTYLTSLGRESNTELIFLYSRMATLLSNPLESKNSYLPSSGKAINAYQEVLLLFWTIICTNSVSEKN